MQDFVLMIDDNENDYIIFKKYIGDKYIMEYNDGQKDVFETIVNCQPKCILLDYNLGTRNGISILQRLKNNQALSSISVIMLTNEKDPKVIVQSMMYDATNYLVKDDVTKDDLIFAIKNSISDTILKQEMEAKQQKILHLLQMDDLTGLYNRRYFIEMMDKEIERSKRGNVVFSVSIVDLDGFKNINDTYGHLTGDNTLKVTAKAIDKNIRKTDYACRYGGDEFIIAMLELSGNSSEKVALAHLSKLAKIKTAIETDISDYFKEYRESEQITAIPNIKITASIGFCMFSQEKENFYDLFNQADNALYWAKQNGKNKIGH